jgi:peroxiredoxin
LLIREKKLGFALLSDPGNRVAKKFGLVYKLPEDLKRLYLAVGVDLEKFNGEDPWTLPIPARYIVDPSGIIRYRESNPDYTIRPEPEDTIQALKAML